jgi:uncharacterized membrane protein YeiB
MSRWTLCAASPSSDPASQYQRLRLAEGRLPQPGVVREHSLSDAWTWAILDLFAQVKFLTLFALLFGAGLQMLLPRGKRWIQSRLTLLALLGFIHGLLFWDGDILLAYALVGLVAGAWCAMRITSNRCLTPASCSTSSALRCSCCWA